MSSEMELVNRAGESGRIPFRSSRFFCVGNKWYFSTREGFDSGPYADKCRAELGLKRFLHILQMLPQPHTERQALASSSS